MEDLQLIIGIGAGLITLCGFLYYVFNRSRDKFNSMADRLNKLEEALQVKEKYLLKYDCFAHTDDGTLILLEEGEEFVLTDIDRYTGKAKGKVFHQKVTVFLSIDCLKKEQA